MLCVCIWNCQSMTICLTTAWSYAKAEKSDLRLLQFSHGHIIKIWALVSLCVFTVVAVSQSNIIATFPGDSQQAKSTGEESRFAELCDLLNDSSDLLMGLSKKDCKIRCGSFNDPSLSDRGCGLICDCKSKTTIMVLINGSSPCYGL